MYACMIGFRGFRDTLEPCPPTLLFRVIDTPITENQMENKMENEMETGFIGNI